MIRKLRIRFILLNMLLISIAMIVIFSAIIISTIQKSEGSSYAYLESKLRRDEPDKHFADEVPPKTAQMPGDVFEFIINGNNIIVGYNGDLPTTYSVSDIDAYDLIEMANDIGENKGLIRSENLRFVIGELDENRTMYAFMDITHEIDFVYQQVQTYIIIGILGLLVFCVISFYLSKMVVKPVEIAFNKQKQFISDASHELKTPLTVILANLSMIKKKDADINRYIGTIDNESRRMKLLVEDLLHLSKLEEGKRNYVKATTNISDIVWECVLAFEPVAYEKGLKIDSNIENDITETGVPKELKKLTCILLDNACKYSLSNSTISVVLKKNNGKTVLSVNNASEVIETEQLENLFSRFYRVDKSRNRESGSFGLGLALAKRIVDIHNGNISVTNSEKNGTTFTITI